MELGSLGWRSAPFASFNTIVDQVFSVVTANKNVAMSRGWPIERHKVEAWVDESNALRCQQNGWHEFVLPDDPAASPAATSEQWPLWARAVSKFRKEGEVGVGDTVRRLIGNDNSDAFKNWYKDTFNRDCGCCGRGNNFNLKYKYK